jgi:hypothetical protein
LKSAKSVDTFIAGDAERERQLGAEGILPGRLVRASKTSKRFSIFDRRRCKDRSFARSWAAVDEA